MAQELSDMIVRIGTRLSRVKPGPNVAIDDPNPIIAWNIPDNIQQERFSVRIEAVENDSFAFVTSGPQSGSHDHFQIPPGVALNESFAGLCKIEVAISENVSGDFEWLSPPCFFVYDRNLEQLHFAEEVRFFWQDAIDPDFVPASGHKYQVQVGLNPLFVSNETLVYDGEQEDNSSPIVFHEPPVIPPSGNGFNPLDDSREFYDDQHTYFYRVRCWDGLDWGRWSQINAFHNYDHLKPVFEFLSITYTGNRWGDIEIKFKVSDQDIEPPFWRTVCAELTFQEGSENPKPLSLVNSTMLFPLGEHTVIWRASRQLKKGKNTVTIFGRALDHFRFSNTDQIKWTGDISIHDYTVEETPAPADFVVPENFGSLFLKYPIEGVATKLAASGPIKDSIPVVNEAIKPEKGVVNDMAPLQGNPYAWWNNYVILPTEPRAEKGGFGHTGVNSSSSTGRPSINGTGVRAVYWQQPMANFNVADGPTWNYDGVDTSAKRVFECNEKEFMFKSPVDNERDDTIPVAFSSRHMHLSGYLYGFIDLDGQTQAYPNEYDWNQRPDWHIGREIWKQNDAWIQVMYWKFTDYKVCETCEGRGWEPHQDGSQFVRRKCSNPHCIDGFDSTQPRWRTYGIAPNQKTRVEMKRYFDIKWYRLSTFLDGTAYESHERYGWPIAGGPYLFFTQHIQGSQPSSIDKDGNSFVVGERTLPENTGYVWEPRRRRTFSPGNESESSDNTIWNLHRDPKGAIRISSDLFDDEKSEQENISTPIAPAVGVTKSKEGMDEHVSPVQGNIATPTSDFVMAGVDPASHPAHAYRADERSLQPGSVLIQGNLERSYQFRALDFRFLPAWWDAYITLHFAANGSETSVAHVQYARKYGDDSWSEYRDVLGDNAIYDHTLKAWVVKPLSFHEYWDTHRQEIFAEGADFRLRIRQYDPVSKTISEFLYSKVFTILHGVANPVNMLTMVYEPWSKQVTITFRLDDTQYRPYDLIRFWYSKDDGYTWVSVSPGDIFGETKTLESGIGDAAPVHSLIWSAEGYDLLPGDNYRFRIESVPSGYLDESMYPFFKWSGPLNPFIDQSENTLADYVGRVESLRFDGEVGRWVERTTPYMNPGQLFYLQRELEHIRNFATTSAPDGIYTFVSPSGEGWPPVPVGSVPDPSGYILPSASGEYYSWLESQYSAAETIGQAMRRTSESIERVINVIIPAAQKDIIDGERAIRKDLVGQGYYVEEYFLNNDEDEVREYILADAVSSQFGEEIEGVTQEREWKYRVQNYATGGENLYATDGSFRPKFMTNLEEVFYKIQLDGSSNFDSQPDKKPVREFLFDWAGQRLTVSELFGGKPIAYGDDSLAASQDDTGRPWEDQASDRDGVNQFDQSATSDLYPVGQYGGMMKIAPKDLPGEQQGDTLPQGWDKWDGSYYWRFRAYNRIVAPFNSRPRPLITKTESIGGMLISMEYQMQGDDRIISASLRFGTNLVPQIGYQISRQVKDPTWEETAVYHVSDQRGSNENFAQNNNIPLLPRSTDRSYPTIFYDNDIEQYRLFSIKPTLTNIKYRPVESRAVELPTTCEYDIIHAGTSDKMILRPVIIKALGQYFMFTTSVSAGNASYLTVSTSDDGENWSIPTQLNTPVASMMCSVVYHNGLFHMWYQSAVSGVQKIFYATSDDGLIFDMLNGGLHVYGESTHVTVPGIIRINNAWIMYLNNGSDIISVWSSDGINWQGRKIEIQPFISGGETYTPCNPFPYLDRYRGNEELFLMFNYRKQSDLTNAVYFARLEDRVWINGVSSAYHGTKANVSSSGDGVMHTATIDMYPHGIIQTDPVKIRLIFGGQTPEMMEYHRQSAWVTQQNADEVDGYMDPKVWLYNSLLKFVPYMRSIV